MSTLLVTGGAGFVGSALVRQLIDETDATVVNVDSLTYAGDLDSLADVLRHPRHVFERVDIRERREVERLFREHRPDAVLHLAAETHVDRSIDAPTTYHSRSVQGTLRGLHYQIRQSQGKLVRVTAGEVFDVAVDLRKSSPTFGRWVSAYLSADDKRMLWIPPGFGHGFYVTAGPAEVQYKCSDYYAPAHERCIRWDDAELAIEWPLNGDPILSDSPSSAGVRGRGLLSLSR